jgi:hypothetical protein
LGFDEAQDVKTAIQGAATSEFLPGWTLTLNGVEQTQIDVNTLGNASRFGFAVLNRFRFNPLQAPAEHLYSLLVVNGSDPDLTWQLTQRGTIPLDAASLQFKTFNQAVFVSADGTELPLLFLQHEGEFDVYGVDIRPFAGQTVNLGFSTRATGVADVYGIDTIQFSAQVVPEPGSASVFVLGALFLIGLKRLQDRRSPHQQ